MDFTRPFRRRYIAGVGWVKLAPGSGADPQEADGAVVAALNAEARRIAAEPAIRAEAAAIVEDGRRVGVVCDADALAFRLAVERVIHSRRMVCVVDYDGAAVWQDVDGGWRVVVWTAADAPPAPDADPLVDASDASTIGFKVGAPSA